MKFIILLFLITGCGFSTATVTSENERKNPDEIKPASSATPKVNEQVPSMTIRMQAEEIPDTGIHVESTKEKKLSKRSLDINPHQLINEYQSSINYVNASPNITYNHFRMNFDLQNWRSFVKSGEAKLSHLKSIEEQSRLKSTIDKLLKKAVFPNFEIIDHYESNYILIGEEEKIFYQFEYNNGFECAELNNTYNYNSTGKFKIYKYYDDCTLSAHNLSFHRNFELPFCMADKCTTKYTRKTAENLKDTRGSKAGVKAVISGKLELGSTVIFVTKGEVGGSLETSGEFHNLFEDASTEETALEESFELHRDEFALPIRFDVALDCKSHMRFENPRSHTMSSPVKLLKSCDQPLTMKYLTKEREVLPLIDERGKVIRIQFVYVHK